MTNGSSAPIDARRLFLNGWGTLCFVLFLGALGTAEYKYIAAVLSWVIMAWAMRAGPSMLPECVSSGSGGSPLTRPLDYLPVWIGGACLTVLALLPLATGRWPKYLAFLEPLVGIRF
jgi:hypothetical protein